MSQLKGGFWKRWFRCGYNASGYHSAEYNGNMSKRDVKSTRTKFKQKFKELVESITSADDE